MRLLNGRAKVRYCHNAVAMFCGVRGSMYIQTIGTRDTLLLFLFLFLTKNKNRIYIRKNKNRIYIRKKTTTNRQKKTIKYSKQQQLKIIIK